MSLRGGGMGHAVFDGMNDCRQHSLDLKTSAIAAVSVTAVWYALIFVADIVRPRELPSLPLIWTLLAGLCPLIGTVFAVLMLLMHRRGGRMNGFLFYGAFAACLTPWCFWAFL
jgi:hypothetical protein